MDESITRNYADVLIIGGGIAGLTTAIKVASHYPDKKVTLISKDRPGESNSRYAQGGIAVVMDYVNDSFHQHVSDTLKAGDNVCNKEVVEMVVREGPERLIEVMRWGARFDFHASGNLALGLEGGHSVNRIVHSKDETGFQVISVLLRLVASFKNIEVHWNCLVLELITAGEDKGKICTGAMFINRFSEQVHLVSAAFVVLATGGAGQVYRSTTNSAIATGDGIAMAYRAGASIADMHYVQFHPTALNFQQTGTVFLISEALRGFGAYLCTSDGMRFMFNYHLQGEMAPRHIVASAIHKESINHSVYLDCRHLSKESLQQCFPNIYKKCLSNGIDIATELIPIVPAAHYLCGGIVTDPNAQTTIDRLYAVGECACTGLHGANRLASNSLLEALVFAHHCFADIQNKITLPVRSDYIPKPAFGSKVIVEQELKEVQEKLKSVMSQEAGIIRTTSGLRRALNEITELSRQLETLLLTSRPSWILSETRNLLAVSRLILQHSLEQKVNRGTFHNQDLAVNVSKDRAWLLMEGSEL